MKYQEVSFQIKIQGYANELSATPIPQVTIADVVPLQIY